MGYLSHREFQNKYDLKVPFTRYWGFVEAIPLSWKTMLCSNGDPESERGNNLKQELAQTTKIVSKLYNRLSVDDSLLDDIIAKWETKLAMDLDRQEFITLLRNINLTTINVKLRSFHYRLLYNAILTNMRLLHMKLVDTNLCSFCFKELETYQHLFYMCKYAQVIIEYIKHKSNREFNVEKFLLNCIRSNPCNVINTITIIAKYCCSKKNR